MEWFRNKTGMASYVLLMDRLRKHLQTNFRFLLAGNSFLDLSAALLQEGPT